MFAIVPVKYGSTVATDTSVIVKRLNVPRNCAKKKAILFVENIENECLIVRQILKHGIGNKNGGAATRAVNITALIPQLTVY